ncbi:hypothetical protein NQ315_011545 [Exocentrus adspersus]|uniref:Peptidase S1 domain-containing protein n=1 Tax=Exocentrus adspersus TaxID=1586481 RepID=A0AAV8VUP4_9CUCU|nr:hypothetical protein NQ315_011545 [Exocentrus adspersus]
MSESWKYPKKTSVLGQGKSVPMLDGRIVGGVDVDIADYPYQVSVQMLSFHYCGGAIISTRWVLSAAHCTDRLPIPSFFSIRVGSTTRNAGGLVYSVLSLIIHPEYTREALDYDIALLRVSSDILATNARTIVLPTIGKLPEPNAIATITGWGTLTEGGSAPSILQMVQVPIVDQEVCSNAYFPSVVTDRMFCAGLLDVGGQDACQGDSGGPLVVNGTLVGLVSWGRGCARPGYPGVYTNLYDLRLWIAINSGI